MNTKPPFNLRVGLFVLDSNIRGNKYMFLNITYLPVKNTYKTQNRLENVLHRRLLNHARTAKRVSIKFCGERYHT